MNPFKIFKIRKLVKEARENPGKLAGEEIRGVLWGLFIIPIVIAILGLVLFFLVGYTQVLGFQIGFFKFLFWLALFVGLTIFTVLRRIVRAVGTKAQVGTSHVVEVVGKEFSSSEKEV